MSDRNVVQATVEWQWGNEWRVQEFWVAPKKFQVFQVDHMCKNYWRTCEGDPPKCIGCGAEVPKNIIMTIKLLKM